MSVASGFVDFTTGRNSIVTAPGPGSPAQVKVFYFSLMKPIDQKPADAGGETNVPGAKEAAVTTAFMPFGIGYRGRRVAGHRLAYRIARRRRGDRRRPTERSRRGESLLKRLGTARRPYDLSAAAAHTPVATFAEIASFNPFGEASGVSVATTSTTVGADLLVSGVSPEDNSVQVLKFELVRPDPDAVTLAARQLSTVVTAPGSLPNALGGD